MRHPTLVVCLLIGATPAFAAETVEKWRTHQLTFTTATSVANPFDTYLLELRLTRPDGSALDVEGFYDDLDGAAPFTWRVRLCPDQTGTWNWTTIAGDASATWNEATSGSFTVVDVGDPGPLTTDGPSFEWRGTGEPVYLYGNFLDASGPTNEKYTHVYFSEEITDTQRNNMRARHQNLWRTNKVNIYYANNGDYGDISTTPWMGTEGTPDYTRMNLARWALYDTYLKDWKEAGALVWMWFFADDSSFSSLAAAHQDRLVRYAMARHSAYSHLSFIMALETNESGQLTTAQVERLGAYAETKNPWQRLLSSHQMQSYGSGSTIGCTAILTNQAWMDFYASQVGLTCNSSSDATLRRRVFECGKTLYDGFPTRPHASEEFAFCSSDAAGQNPTCRELTWGAFLSGGGAGSGTDLENLSEFIAASRVPFQRMRPDASILSGGTASGYARYEAGQHYLIYKTTTSSSISVTTTGSGLSGRWWDPAHRSASLSAPFTIAAGAASYTPPSNPTGQWVLWITSGSDLNSVRLHPDPQTDTFVAGGGTELQPPEGVRRTDVRN